MIQDRIEYHLENWRDYMRRDNNELGYPSKSLVLSTGGSSGSDEFDIMCDDCDIECALTMDGIIDSISEPQRTAVNHKWLEASHHYPTQELDYEQALIEISKLADKRGLI